MSRVGDCRPATMLSQRRVALDEGGIEILLRSRALGPGRGAGGRGRPRRWRRLMFGVRGLSGGPRRLTGA
jgi:hypothetical protein